MLHIKLSQFAVRGALPPRRSESPLCATDNKASCVLHLLGWFIGLRGFSSLERRPEFWVLHWWTYLQGSSGDADIENRLMDTERGRSEWVKVARSCPILCDLQSWATRSMEFWRREWDKSKEWHGNICVSLCKTVSHGNLLYDAGSSTHCSVTT